MYIIIIRSVEFIFLGFRVLILANIYITSSIIPELIKQLQSLVNRDGGSYVHQEVVDSTLDAWTDHIVEQDLTNFNFIIVAPGSREFQKTTKTEMKSEVISISKLYLQFYKKLKAVAPQAKIFGLELPPRAGGKILNEVMSKVI